jgi:hypothetical protein
MVCSAGAARANGRFPSASQLVTHPRDHARMLLRTTYGILLTRDGGGHWDWVCERAVGYGGIEDPAVVITGDGALLAGMFAGLSASTDEGCSWKHAEDLPSVVVDLALRSPADTVYAVTGRYAGKGDAGSLFKSELYVAAAAGADGGKAWALRASLDPTLLLESVEVAPSDPQRVYVTAIRDDSRSGGAHGGVLLVSEDDGRHWLERPVALEPQERAPFIAAVDPGKPDRVYLRTSGPERNRLLVTDDAGKTVRTLFTGGALLGFALSEAGDKVYLGGMTDGLLVASVPEYRFEKRWAMPAQCLTVVGRTLWACSAPQSGFELGTSEDDGASFTPRLTLAGMRGPLSCAGPTSMSKCPLEWDKLQADFGVVKAPAGASSAAAGSTASATSRCGCDVPGRPVGAGGLLAALLVGLGASMRRRRLGS